MTLPAVEIRSRAVIAELRRRRLEAGLSQRRLAERVGYGHDVIRRIEGNLRGSVNIDLLMRYAEALGYELDFKITPKQDADLTPVQSAQT